jgi:omega-hydroxy-beta-dihydromenaquinone-9 sulfotransferase
LELGGKTGMNIRYSVKNYLNFTSHTAMGIDLLNWLRLLAKNRLGIHFLFIPKAMFLTLTVMVNLPFQLLEYLIYNKRIKTVKVKEPVFVLGHHRSGTTYLQNVLCKDPRFTYCSTYEGLVPHIFLLSGKPMSRLLDSVMPKTRPQDNVKAGAAMPTEEEFAMGNISQSSFMHGLYFPKSIFKTFDEEVVFEKKGTAERWKKHLHYFVKKLLLKHADQRIVLKSPSNTARVKEILELYPDAKFIHIHRNPYEVYVSNENLYSKILPLLGFQKVKSAFIQQFLLYSYEKLYRKYLSDKALIPSNSLYELAYHDFVNAPIEQLEKAYQHLQLGDFEVARPHLAKEVQESKDYKKNSYDGMDEKTKATIHEKWGFFFEEYSYEKS